MALHLNLYHEIQKKKALKRRDPLKISIFGLGAIAAVFALVYAMQLLKLHSLTEDLAKIQAEHDKLAPSAKVAKKHEDELAVKQTATDTMVHRIEGRFYWAPILEQVMRVVPKEVQLTRLGGDIPTDGSRRCVINIDGLSAGSDPRKVAEDLRTALADTFTPKFKPVTSTFRALEDGSEMVMLDGRQVPTATFAITVQMPLGEDKSAATPAPRRKR